MPWVSLKKSVSDLERLAERIQDYVLLQTSMVDTLRHNVLEIDASAAGDLRSLLDSLRRQMERSESEAALDEIRLSFEGGWSRFCARSSSAYRQIQEELSDTVRVLQETLTSLDPESGENAEQRIAQHLNSLKALIAIDDIESLRVALSECIERLSSAVADLRRERNLAVTQLRDEIRALQKHLDFTERAAAVDYITGVTNRKEMERLVANSINSRKPFWLVYVWLRNFKHLERELPRPLADRVISMASGEMLKLLPEQTTLSRWSDDEFCALIGNEKQAALALTRVLSTQLNTHFSIQGEAQPKTVTLKAHVGVVESHSDEDPERFFYRSDKLIKAIQGAA